jgi:hypothetical protein
MTSACFDDVRAQELALSSAGRDEASHLAACAACRERVEGYRALGLSLAALRSPAPPPGFAEGVLARIEARRHVAAGELRLALWGALLLAPAMLVSLGSLWVAARSVGDGASLLSGGAALVRALASVASALAPLQALLALGCAALCLPLLWAIHRLLPAANSSPELAP